MDFRNIHREQVSDFVWKWRCKFLRGDDAGPKKASDLDSASDDEDANVAAGTFSKDPTFGTDAAVKTMYEGRNSSCANYEWVDYPPKQLSRTAARVQDRVAIKVYKVKDRDKPCIAGHFPLKHHRLEIQNAGLVAALQPILKKENVHLDVNSTATFHEPFRSLWFCHGDIVELHQSTNASSPLKPYLTLFLRILDGIFSDLQAKWKHLQASGLVDFHSAWALFSRGCTLYSHGLNADFLAKVEGTEYVREEKALSLQIRIKTLVFDGQRFVWRATRLVIDEYEGNKPIKELQHHPISFHPSGDDVTERLIQRGKKVLDLQGLRYCSYNGIAIQSAGKEVSKHLVQGRILIDVFGYNKHHLAQGRRERKEARASWCDEYLFGSYSDSDSVSSLSSFSSLCNLDGSSERRLAGRLDVNRPSEFQIAKSKKEIMQREEDLQFMSGTIGGFALKNKLWVEFYVEEIEPMAWNDTAFSHLVYDSQQKDLVLSFVENHKPGRDRPQPGLSADPAAPMDDVIVGKGQGLIVLLSGPPGTGKTLTAEAVADQAHKPLYYLQAEDLGLNAAALCANIKRVFQMATEWDAVILLDEADVFMAERNPNDIHRNELVSIFLRELEYFRGIIFLTTNLYNTIDTAFRSRVSLHLLFHALDRNARETVWRKFLDRLPGMRKHPVADDDDDDDDAETRPAATWVLDNGDIHQLSLWSLNGREIKNAVRMVHSWCQQKGYTMTLERLESGIRVTNPHATKSADTDDSLYE
ncbi:hypothetical protein RJ55_06872 [Drechmeria coniospora]|nr:hypothetical protein RJ55_06872 [Drechmeria coniospora]